MDDVGLCILIFGTSTNPKHQTKIQQIFCIFDQKVRIRLQLGKNLFLLLMKNRSVSELYVHMSSHHHHHVLETVNVFTLEIFL